jgi:predicted ATPase/Flp pilus assembly protein TadD
VTSRERLNLTGEWVYSIGGLAFPHGFGDDSFEGYDAIDLFLDRLRQVRSGNPLHHDERPDVVRICQLVDGMPLALELAAAWANTLTLREIAEGVRHSLDFLSASSRDQPDRHRSMRAVFDSSWEMLTTEEQAAWRRFSIFENGFTLDAAQHVAGATLQSLAALINKSLMKRFPSGRYRLHGLLKQFGDEKLREHPDEYTDVVERHTRYYLQLMANQNDQLTGGDQSAAMEVIENDIENIRLAWQRGVEQELMTELIAAAPSYWLFLVIHGWMREGQSTFEVLLEAMKRLQPTTEEEFHDNCLAVGMAEVYKGGFESGLGLYDGAISLLNEGISCLREVTTGRTVGIALNMLAAALNMRGQYAEARVRLEESLEELDRVRDDWGKAFSLNDLGMILHLRFHDDTGEQYCAQSRDIFMQLGDNRGQAFAASNLGLIAMQRGDYQRALRLHREALALSEARNDQWGVAMSLVQLGRVHGLMEDDVRASEHLHQAVRIAWENSIAPVVLEALSEVAAMDIRGGNHERARTILTAIARHPSVQNPVREHVLGLLQALDEDDNPVSNVATGDRWAVRIVNDVAQSLLLEAVS